MHLVPLALTLLAPVLPQDDTDPLSARSLENLVALTHLAGVVRYFHPSDEAARLDWDAFTVAAVARVERCASAEELTSTLAELFAPIAPSAQVGTELHEPPPDPPAAWLVWRHQMFGLADFAGGIGSSERVRRTTASLDDSEDPEDLPTSGESWTRELAPGVWARVPLTVAVVDGETSPPGSGTAALAEDTRSASRATRLAAVASTWSALQHFHPYLDEVHADWPGRLREALAGAAVAADPASFLATLELLVAALEDGHAAVTLAGAMPTHGLPFVWEWIEGRPILTSVPPVEGGRDVGAPGDEVVLLGGVPALELIRERERFVSASTPQYRRMRAMNDITYVRSDEPVPLRLRAPDGAVRDVEVQPIPVQHWPWAPTVARGERPDSFTELAEGVLYVDVNTLTPDEFVEVLPDLAAARGLVFDVRYYPRAMYYPAYVSHLIDAPFEGMRSTGTVFTRPDRVGVHYPVVPWRPEPEGPRLPDNVVFLASRVGLSSAESHLGIVEAGRLGPIVGEATGGTNGNVFSFSVPGGVSISMTGLLVQKAGGGRLYGVGVLPTERVERTVAGIAAGRDEILERAVEIARDRLK